MAFVDVVSGNVTATTDVNQLIDALNGTVAAQITIKATSNAVPAANFLLPSAPTGDQAVSQNYVSGDAQPRIAGYIRGADGYGGIKAGAGTSIVAHLYAQTTGWRIPESLRVDGTLSQNGVNVVLEGSHSAGQPIISYGSGTPASLAANEIFVQLS